MNWRLTKAIKQGARLTCVNAQSALCLVAGYLCTFWAWWHVSGQSGLKMILSVSEYTSETISAQIQAFLTFIFAKSKHWWYLTFHAWNWPDWHFHFSFSYVIFNIQTKRVWFYFESIFDDNLSELPKSKTSFTTHKSRH